MTSRMTVARSTQVPHRAPSPAADNTTGIGTAAAQTAHERDAALRNASLDPHGADPIWVSLDLDLEPVTTAFKPFDRAAFVKRGR